MVLAHHLKNNQNNLNVSGESVNLFHWSKKWSESSSQPSKKRSIWRKQSTSNPRKLPGVDSKEAFSKCVLRQPSLQITYMLVGYSFSRILKVQKSIVQLETSSLSFQLMNLWFLKIIGLIHFRHHLSLNISTVNMWLQTFNDDQGGRKLIVYKRWFF